MVSALIVKWPRASGKLFDFWTASFISLKNSIAIPPLATARFRSSARDIQPLPLSYLLIRSAFDGRYWNGHSPKWGHSWQKKTIALHGGQ